MSAIFSTPLPPAMQDLHLLSGLMNAPDSDDWKARVKSESPFDPFDEYCSRTGANVGRLSEDAIRLLLQVTESLHPGDSEAQLIHLQNTALRHMKPCPAWSYLTPEILRLLGEQDPYGTGVYLASQLFRRASLKSADSLDRNEWLIRLRVRFDSLPVTQVREINSLLFGLDAACGLTHVRRMKDFDLENPITSFDSFIEYLRREYTLASDPAPFDDSRYYYDLSKSREEERLQSKAAALNSNLRGDFMLPVPTPKEKRAALDPVVVAKKRTQSRNVTIDNTIAMSLLKSLGATDFATATEIRKQVESEVPQFKAAAPAPTRASFADLLAKSQAAKKDS